MPGLPQELAKRKIGEVDRFSYLVSLNPFSKITEAVSTLLGVGISSCVVRSAEYSEGTPSGSTHASYYCGLIDLLDVVAYFTKLYTAAFEHKPQSDTFSIDVNQWRKNEASQEALREAIKKFNTCTVADLLTDPNLTLRYSQVTVDTPLDECAAKLGPGKNQRLLVVDNEFKIVNIITQTSLLQYVARELTTKPDLFRQAQPLLDLTLSNVLIERPNPEMVSTTMKVPLVDPSPGSLYTVRHDQLAIEAFNLMYTHKVSGVAVVDDHNSLLGNISCRDIRALITIHNQFEHLSSTAFEYLELIKSERVENTSKMYIKKKHYEELHEEQHKEEELTITEDGITTQKVVPPLPKNSILDNVAKMLTSHSNLPSILTITNEDSIGYTMSVFLKNRVRRVYMTSGRLLSNGHTCQIPVSIITLSDMMLIFSGKASTLSF